MRVLFPLKEIAYRVKKDRSYSEKFPYVLYIDDGTGEQVWSSYLDRETALQEAIAVITTFYAPKPQTLAR